MINVKDVIEGLVFWLEIRVGCFYWKIVWLRVEDFFNYLLMFFIELIIYVIYYDIIIIIYFFMNKLFLSLYNIKSNFF